MSGQGATLCPLCTCWMTVYADKGNDMFSSQNLQHMLDFLPYFFKIPLPHMSDILHCRVRKGKDTMPIGQHEF